mgnify:CR=1 FL=1
MPATGDIKTGKIGRDKQNKTELNTLTQYIDFETGLKKQMEANGCDTYT